MSRHASHEFKRRFGDEMRRARLEHGYSTIEDLSDALHIPAVYLRHLEQGRFCETVTLPRLARFYNKRLKTEFFE